MKIELKNISKHWRYLEIEYIYTVKQYDYIFKYLDFDKLDKNMKVYFCDKTIEKLFYETYIYSNWLNVIYNQSPEGYEWLKENWGKNVFKVTVYNQDKQKLKNVVNKICNVKLIRSK